MYTFFAVYFGEKKNQPVNGYAIVQTA